MPSRRALIAGAGGLGLAAVGAGVAPRIRVEGIDSWSPGPDTWPLSRYDPANTAANPGAAVPTDPGVAWRRAVLGPTVETALVVGREAVYAADVTYTDSLTALDRRDGTVRWRYGRHGGYLGLHDGTLYAVAGANRPGADLYAFEAAGGTLRWRAELDPASADHVIAADRTVLVAGSGDVGAYGADDGARRWTIDGPHQHPTGIAVRQGGLYATVGDRIVGFRARSLLDRALGRSPPMAWHTDRIHDPGVPALAGDRVLVGVTVGTAGGANGDPPPALAAYAIPTGERIWGALRPDATGDSSGDGTLAIHTPAIVGDRGVLTLEFDGPGGADTPDDRPAHGVAAVSLADGAVLWRRAIDRRARDAAAAGDAVVLGTGRSEEGAVVALDPADGRERWRVAFDAGVSSVAVVDGAVFATTVDGSVVALR